MSDECVWTVNLAAQGKTAPTGQDRKSSHQPSSGALEKYSQCLEVYSPMCWYPVSTFPEEHRGQANSALNLEIST
jgi:hypothetical protein